MTATNLCTLTFATLGINVLQNLHLKLRKGESRVGAGQCLRATQLTSDWLRGLLVIQGLHLEMDTHRSCCCESSQFFPLNAHLPEAATHGEDCVYVKRM